MKTVSELLSYNSVKTLLANRSARLRPRTAIFTQRIFHSVVLGAALLLAQTAIADPAQRDFTGSLNTERHLHTATLLPSGKVLVVGGLTDTTYTATAELYDPGLGTWTPTGNLNLSRALQHSHRWQHPNPIALGN